MLATNNHCNEDKKASPFIVILKHHDYNNRRQMYFTALVASKNVHENDFFNIFFMKPYFRSYL